jgi:hypothetical protein
MAYLLLGREGDTFCNNLLCVLLSILPSRHSVSAIDRSVKASFQTQDIDLTYRLYDSTRLARGDCSTFSCLHYPG